MKLTQEQLTEIRELSSSANECFCIHDPEKCDCPLHIIYRGAPSFVEILLAHISELEKEVEELTAYINKIDKAVEREFDKGYNVGFDEAMIEAGREIRRLEDSQ